MTDRVRWIIEFHQTTSFGTRANLVLRQNDAHRLYESLDEKEVSFLVEAAISGIEQDSILTCLACFQPGSLRPFHELLVEQRIFYPGLIFHGAVPSISQRLVEAIMPGSSRTWSSDSGTENNLLDLNFILLALAWIGDEFVQRAFAEWRQHPPSWAGTLHMLPHEYAPEAGWELTESGSRRNLFRPTAFPLVRPDDPLALEGPVRVGFDGPGLCDWCGQQLTAMFDLDLSNPALRYLGFAGDRLCILTCHLCTCYGSVFTNVGFDGASAWSTANRKPDYLPADRSEDRFARGRLLLSSKPRHFLASASWLLPGVSNSQIGGCPTWIQDAEYPRCPSCSQRMPFVGQVSVEDCAEYGEGIYYTFCCRDCGVAATGYQQS